MLVKSEVIEHKDKTYTVDDMLKQEGVYQCTSNSTVYIIISNNINLYFCNTPSKTLVVFKPELWKTGNYTFRKTKDTINFSFSNPS